MPPFELDVWWKPSADTLHVGMGMQYDLSPLANPKKVASSLSRSVEPFLEGICDSSMPNSLSLQMEPDGVCVPCYDAYIDHAPLDDGEIEAACRGTIMRGSRMLMLLSSTFYCMERGYMPDASERMELLLLEHGLWEVRDLSYDVPERGARLPKRLFGAVGTLLAQ